LGYRLESRKRLSPNPATEYRGGPAQAGFTLGVYKIFVYFESFVHESTIVCPPPPTCIAHPGAIPLHDYCAVYGPPSDLLFVSHTPYNIANNNIL